MKLTVFAIIVISVIVATISFTAGVLVSKYYGTADTKYTEQETVTKATIALNGGSYIYCNIENIQVEWDRQILIVIKNGQSEIYPLHNIVYIKVPKGYYLY